MPDEPDPRSPEPAPAGLPPERALIALVDAALREAGIPADLTDDCAHLDSETRLVTTDTLVEGRHFDLQRDTPYQAGRQAAVVNLSDLAASGGAAGWLVWSLNLPAHWTTDTVRELVRGFVSTAAEHGARVVGGNLSGTDGPAVVAVTAGGPLAGGRPLTRDGARPGDAIYVTGCLGDAALGYLDADRDARTMRHAWRPHLLEARALAEWGQVSAAMDVSDGLALDLDRLCRASGVTAALKSAAIPITDHYRTRRGDDLSVALTGGEDYVLLFCAPADAPPPTEANAICIGHIDGPGPHRIRLDGQPLSARGHDHFGGA